MVLRNPSPKEFMLLEFLVGEADLSEASEVILEGLKVADMDDGGMGSLRLFPKGSDDRDKKIGKCASTCHFTDEDGVEVVASLNLDQHGNLYELDMWKTDFGKLIRIPDNRKQLRREEM
ncbi:DUF6984 family protein [Chloracidobacterium validum]|nr:hypothetical protein [Chloracidobacterium validum]